MAGNKFSIRKRDGSIHGPYSISVIKAFLVSGKFRESDVLLGGGEEVPLFAAEELQSFWAARGGIGSRKLAGPGEQKGEEMMTIGGTIPKIPTQPGLRKKNGNPTQAPLQGRVVFFRGRVLPPGSHPTYAGNLLKNSVVTMLYRLLVAKKTGRIHFRQGREIVDVFLEKGRPAYAASTDERTRLGDILVSFGMLKRQELSQALQLQQQKRKPLAQILVHEGLVAPAKLQKVFLQQLQERLYRVFRWQQGIYRFYANQVTGSQFPMKVEPLKLIREGTLAHVPDALIAEQLSPYRNKRVARLLNPLLRVEELGLSSAQLDFYHSITNQDSLNDVVGSAVEQSHYSEEQVYALVYLFWKVDLLKMGEEMVGQRTQKQIEEMKFGIRRLEKQSRLQRLGLEGGASAREIRQAYIRLAKQYHPDHLPPGTHPEVAKLSEEYFALIAEAYRILS